MTDISILQDKERLSKFVDNLIIELNDRYKHISKSHECFNEISNDIRIKTLKGIKNFNVKIVDHDQKLFDKKLHSFTSTLIRCYLLESKKKHKDINIEQGNCKHCLLMR